MTPTPFESRHTALHPPSAPIIDHLYHLASTREIPWEWGGPAETPDAFHRSLAEQVLVQHAIVEKRQGLEIGLVTAYDANLFHGFAYVSLVLLPEYRRKVWPLEGALLFANYLFVRYNLRNLYASSSSANFLQFQSGDGSFYEIEGRLKGRLLVDGEPQDLFLLTVSRELWLEKGLPLLRHSVSGPSSDPSID